jgi:CheY-like chemotaxis protein
MPTCRPCRILGAPYGSGAGGHLTRPGRGTRPDTLDSRLPALDADRPMIRREADPAMPYFQKPLVAVVDDDSHKLRVFRCFIERMGCGVQEFGGGPDFLSDASRDAACVILNEMMPGMNGHEIFHRMRRDGWLVPVISESACPEEELLASYGGGQVAHLLCPWRPDALEDALRKGLVADGYCLPPKGVVAFDPAFLTWGGGTIPNVARTISDERAFHDLPVLGDALEEAGCIDSGILDHCRHPGEHLRGCWVLDRVHALSCTDSFFEVIRCERCEQKLRVPNHLGEITVGCPKCEHRFEWSRALSLLFIGCPPDERDRSPGASRATHEATSAIRRP